MSGDITVGAVGRGDTGQLQEHAAFKVEQRGIDLIPDAERKMKPSGLFWLWSGAVFNVEFFFYGTLIMIFGVSVGQAFLAIAVGNLFYALLGWASLQGRRPEPPRSWSAARRSGRTGTDRWGCSTG
jgi:purine-cytosine permease-like protein